MKMKCDVFILFFRYLNVNGYKGPEDKVNIHSEIKERHRFWKDIFSTL